jgi:CRP-like cAMP-binding protein
MEELDFVGKPARPASAPAPVYDGAIALEFFKSAGKPETVAAGTKLFVENQKASRILKRDKMYLLLQGEVELLARGKPIGALKPGEIFGEMAAISESPRSATAVAKTTCRVIALDDKAFQTALAKKPEFALMLMSLMMVRLRAMMARIDGRSLAAESAKSSRVFDKDVLEILAGGLGDGSRLRYSSGATILKKGDPGNLMYVVLEGAVAVSIDDAALSRIEAGGLFGEMALLDQSPRMASVIAETDCELLAINRAVFLNLMKADPSFGTALLSAVAERVRSIAGRIN